jgi:RNA polymerase sigma-70 factor (ECF subfamily)
MSQRADGQRALEDRLLEELPRIRAFVAKLARGAGLANEIDDMVQEVAARALRYRRAFDVERELSPWLHKAALRVFLDHRERSRREVASVHEVQPVDASTPCEARLDDREEIERLLAKLSAVERDVLTRFHARGESVREIAERLRLPEGTVKSHLHRARRKLAEGRA